MEVFGCPSGLRPDIDQVKVKLLFGMSTRSLGNWRVWLQFTFVRHGGWAITKCGQFLETAKQRFGLPMGPSFRAKQRSWPQNLGPPLNWPHDQLQCGTVLLQVWNFVFSMLAMCWHLISPMLKDPYWLTSMARGRFTLNERTV